MKKMLFFSEDHLNIIPAKFWFK